MKESNSVAEREARFPVVAVSEIPLAKRVVYACCSLGRVEVMRLGNFDADSADEIVVLGTSGVTLLEPGSYTVKRSFNFNVASGMYPDVVPDGKADFC